MSIRDDRRWLWLAAARAIYAPVKDYKRHGFWRYLCGTEVHWIDGVMYGQILSGVYIKSIHNT